ncbi:MAG: tetratricopeptide repeat protein [Bacteroidales bacterium]|nr:tetratricopeptide repeat protein [Bacteroidales bacterium]
MKSILIIWLVGGALNLAAQHPNKIIRQGNSKFEAGNYEEAEVSYRKALDKDAASAKADYNLGLALYKQGKFEDAANVFQALATNEKADKEKAGNYFYNLGNALLKSQKLDAGIEAYKKALINNPGDNQAKYNLSYALAMKQQQQEQQDNGDGEQPEPSEYAKELKNRQKN